MNKVSTITPAEWEACVLQMRQLRAAVERVHYTTEDRRLEHLLLKHIATTRRQIDRILLTRTRNDDTSCNIQLRVLVEKTKQVLDSIIQNKGVVLPSISELSKQRTEDIRAEINTVEALAKESRVVSSDPYSDKVDRAVLTIVDAQKLSGLIQDLRDLEFSMGFREGLTSGLLKQAGHDEYSDDNYAYGSTPFDTWVKVCSLPVLREASRQHKDGQSPVFASETHRISDIRHFHASCVVLGSSTGSLVMFCTMLFQIPCVGVEILPYLHQIAVELQEKHSIPNCAFVNADMLKVTLNSPSIVILTSQCWDEDLYTQVQRKLARELHPGALVVDYRNGFLESPDFTLVSRVEGLRVSWTNTQTIFVYQRQDNPQI